MHKGKTYPGQHDAIIDLELFAAVQSKLATSANEHRERNIRPGGSHLTGLVFDDRNNAMSPSHSRGQTGNAHRYYVSRAIIAGAKQDAGTLGRLPAKPLEELIEDRLARVMRGEEFSWRRARDLIQRVEVSGSGISIWLSEKADAADLAEILPAIDTFDASSRCIHVPVRMGRRGGSVRMLDPSGRRVVDHAEPNQTLIDAIAKGWRWRQQLLSGAYANSTALAEAEGMTQTALHRYIRLAYLAPDLIREILDGRQRPGLSLDQLCHADLPLSWAAQRRLFSARVAG